MAFAACAHENNYTRPRISATKQINIVDGRHPLQEIITQPFIPNSCKLKPGSKNGSVMFLTGANGSGKSMYLKQVALIVYMAQLGSFVPAEAATLGLTDQIFTRIQTFESALAGLSAFMIDLNQVTEAVCHATTDSLIVLDEFGKGTGRNDGLSLLVSVIEEFLARRDTCPQILVSTHYHTVYSMIPSNDLLSYHHMGSIIDNGELIYLYQLSELQEPTTNSLACYSMSAAGLPDELVTRAAEITADMQRGKAIARKQTDQFKSQLDLALKLTHAFLGADLSPDSCPNASVLLLRLLQGEIA